MTLGYPASPVDFAAVVPAVYFFVGSTSPIGRFLPLVIVTARLALEARGAFVIVDTTGLVHEAGRVLKNYKIEAVRPDVIVAVERRSELAAIRIANRHVHIIKIEPSYKAHGKDDYDKIETRRRSYADSEAELERMTQWVVEHLSADVPWHFTAFHPDWRMRDVPPTVRVPEAAIDQGGVQKRSHGAPR